MILFTRFSKGTFNRQGFISISDMLMTTRYVFQHCLKVRNGNSFGIWMVYYEDCPFVLKLIVKSYDTSTGYCAVQILNCEHVVLDSTNQYPSNDNVYLKPENIQVKIKHNSTTPQVQNKKDQNILTDELRAMIFGTPQDTSEDFSIPTDVSAVIHELPQVPQAVLDSDTIEIPDCNVNASSYRYIKTIHVTEDLTLTEEQKKHARERIRAAYLDMRRIESSRAKKQHEYQ